MTQHRFLKTLGLIALAQATSAMTCGPSNIPEVDACSAPGSGAGITSIELGTSDESTFVPIENGTAVTTVRGGQGASMLPVRYRLRGSSLPECIEQKTSLRSGEQQLFAEIPYQIKTYEEADGSRTTKAFYMILDSDPAAGARADLHLEIAGKSLDRILKFESGFPYSLEPQLGPTPIEIAPGGTAILSLRTVWVPFDGIALNTSLNGLTFPAKVDGGFSTFRVHAHPQLEAGRSGSVSVQDESTPAFADIRVSAAVPPGNSDLVIREVFGPSLRELHNRTVEEGDASCDGAVDEVTDQFIELANRSTRALQLEGVQLIVQPFDNSGEQSIYTFAAEVLGPGEAVVVFSGALGDANKNSAARCAKFNVGGKINDAIGYGGADFDLRDYDALEVRSAEGGTVTIADLSQSFSIDVSMEIPNEDALGQDFQPEFRQQTELRFTPGLRNDGRPFAFFDI